MDREVGVDLGGLWECGLGGKDNQNALCEIRKELMTVTDNKYPVFSACDLTLKVIVLIPQLRK